MARPGRGAADKARAATLPRGRGWLVGELGAEAAGYGSQLAHVLAGPQMQALLAAVPGAGRVLRPVCRMLGYDLAQVTLMVAPDVLVARGIAVLPRTDAAAAQAIAGPDGGVALVGVCLGFPTSG